MSPAQNNSEEFPPAPNNTREPTPARDPTSEEPTPVAEGSHNPAHRGISSTAPPMTSKQQLNCLTSHSALSDIILTTNLRGAEPYCCL